MKRLFPAPRRAANRPMDLAHQTLTYTHTHLAFRLARWLHATPQPPLRTLCSFFFSLFFFFTNRLFFQPLLPVGTPALTISIPWGRPTDVPTTSGRHVLSLATAPNKISRLDSLFSCTQPVMQTLSNNSEIQLMLWTVFMRLLINSARFVEGWDADPLSP